jgi:hypothetical protein
MPAPPWSRVAASGLASLRRRMARFLAASGRSRDAYPRQGRTVPWKFFFGACFLTGALLLPHAGLGPLLAGMALAGLIQLAWSRIGGS